MYFNFLFIIAEEFEPTQDSEDDEETIALAEKEAKDVGVELDLLKKESEMSIDDFLDDLPPEYVQALKEGSFGLTISAFHWKLQNRVKCDVWQGL